MIPIAKPILGQREQRAVSQVLASGHLAAGDVVAHFEEEFAKYVGVDHAVATANGSVAIQAALEALGIGPGDEVIVPAFTFVATANAVSYAGAKPVLADVDPATFGIDPGRLKRLVTDSTKAVIGVHLYGQPCDMETLEAFCDREKLALVGDAAQAHGAKIGRKHVGGFGAAETFSFYPTKNMTSGEGGMVTTNQEELAKRLRSITNQGRAEARLGVYDHLRRGHNWRLSNIHAAIGREQLKRLDGFNDTRRAHAKAYDAALKDAAHVATPAVGLGNYHVYHQYTLRCKDRRAVIGSLKEHDVGYGIYYPRALHQYPHLESCAHSALSESAALADAVISIPCHPAVSEDDRQVVIDAVLAGAEKSADQRPTPR